MFWENMNFSGIAYLDADIIKGNSIIAADIEVPMENTKTRGIYIDSLFISWEELLNAIAENKILNEKISMLEEKLVEVENEVKELKKWSQV